MTDEPCNSRNIPLPIQREVRQRCGFGCVMCGLPLYEYEHMAEWAVVKRHVAEEITLLCDQHHREKTGGLLPTQAVVAANANPFNLRGGSSKPYDLHFSGNEAIVNIGSNYFTCQDEGYGTTFIPLMVDSIPLIAFIIADGHLLLNLVIFDEFNVPVLHIKNNQLLYSTIPWDIELVGTRLTIREAKRKILLEIQFSPPNKISITKGRLLKNGIEILVRPDSVLVTNNNIFISNNSSVNCPQGIVLGYNPQQKNCMMNIKNIPRYLGDRSEAIAFEKEALSEFRKEK